MIVRASYNTSRVDSKVLALLLSNLEKVAGAEIRSLRLLWLEKSGG